MTQMIDTPPRDAKPRTNARAIAAVVAGILLSIVGIGVMVVALVLCIAAGSDPGWHQEAAYLLYAVAGFLVSAAGADFRTNAWVALRS